MMYGFHQGGHDVNNIFFLGQVQFTTYFVIYIIIICNSAQERKKKCQHCSHSSPLSFIDFWRKWPSHDAIRS